MFDNKCIPCVGQQLAYCVYLVALFQCLVFCRQCVCVLWTNKWWWWSRIIGLIVQNFQISKITWGILFLGWRPDYDQRGYCPLWLCPGLIMPWIRPRNAASHGHSISLLMVDILKRWQLLERDAGYVRPMYTAVTKVAKTVNGHSGLDSPVPGDTESHLLTVACIKPIADRPGTQHARVTNCVFTKLCKVFTVLTSWNIVTIQVRGSWLFRW